MSRYWEDAYRNGHRQAYPWDAVVSFVMRNAPRDRPRDQVRILEVGCGTASNLWFASREGFDVSGIDISSDAIQFARTWFEREGLKGDLRQGSFFQLPFGDASFDLIIDRCALTCATHDEMRRAILEVTRVAKSGAMFYFNPYCESHSSAKSGLADGSGTVRQITGGSLAGLDQISFYSESDLRRLLSADWEIMSLRRLELLDVLGPAGEIHSEWRVVARRK